MARRAAFIDSVRTEVGGVVLVDAGNFTGHQVETAEARSLFLLEVMKKVDYDAITIGASDTRLGGGLLRSIVQGGEYPFVSANIVDSESRDLVCDPYRIIDRDGLRIGITAVTFFPFAKLESVQAEGFDALDPAESLEKIVPELRREADVVIVLARMHSNRARQLGEHFVDMLDVVVVGNSEGGRGLVHPENGGAVYVTSSDRGQSFGVAKLALADGRVDRVTGDEVILTKRLPEEPEMLSTVQEFQRNLNDLMRIQAATGKALQSSADGHYYLGVESCASCHEREYEIWRETPHAHAFQTLVTAGQEALPECYGCHVTGHGDPIGYDPAVDGDARLVNVQCEVCHDKGSRHSRDGDYGRSLLMNACGQCHDPDNSPDFDAEIYWLMMEH
jgi:hypothetical protein